MHDVSTPADDLLIGRHAAIERIELEPASWVEIVPGFVRNALSRVATFVSSTDTA